MFRIGLGHDTHRFTEGDFIRLGGVSIPHSQSLLGHSDADVLLHAVADALLGATNLGDIGERFPDDDPRNEGRDSSEMLKIVYREVLNEGFRVVNLDSIVFAESPKLSPFKEAIRRSIAQILEISPDLVSVKAKTGEQIGIIGRKEAIAAEVVVLLESIPRTDVELAAFEAFASSDGTIKKTNYSDESLKNFPRSAKESVFNGIAKTSQKILEPERSFEERVASIQRKNFSATTEKTREIVSSSQKGGNSSGVSEE